MTATASVPSEGIGERRRVAESLSRDEARAYARTPKAEWPEVIATAGRLEAGRARPVTLSRNVFVPLTRVRRDYCRYCTFRRDEGDPGDGVMSLDAVRELARHGKAAGCTEALVSLGDKPERVSPQIRAFLVARGQETIIDYLIEACAVLLDEGLLPHANPGVMSLDDLRRLKEVTASQGMMLETTSEALSEPGSAHYRCPDKKPARRVQCLRDAGAARVPFTTGLLIGIGETMADRVDTLVAIAEVHAEYGHIQEVIVQNFKPKGDTPMAGIAPAPFDEFQFVVALARLILGPEMNVQAPPNLSHERYPDLLDAGINDWGGVSPVTVDHINPEAPWPHLDALAHRTQARGKVLRERLTIYPEFITSHDAEGFIAPAMKPYIASLAGDDGYASDG